MNPGAARTLNLGGGEDSISYGYALTGATKKHTLDNADFVDTTRGASMVWSISEAAYKDKVDIVYADPAQPWNVKFVLNNTADWTRQGPPSRRC